MLEGSSPPGKRAKEKKKCYWYTAPLLSATHGQVGIETLSIGIKSLTDVFFAVILPMGVFREREVFRRRYVLQILDSSFCFANELSKIRFLTSWKWKWSQSVVSDSATPRTVAYQDPMDCSLPGFSVHEIFQAIVLEWISISFSRGSSRPRDWTQVSRIVGRCFTVWATR